MIQPIWLLPALPFLGFMILALAGKFLSKKIIASIGIGSVALSFLYAIFLGKAFLSHPDLHLQFTLWDWIQIGTFNFSLTFSIDSLTMVFIWVITGVGGLIHWYSAEYMEKEEGYSRFFAYMNLFVGFMLTLVMAGNLLVLYLGWEGVGLCSYLLIGFFYRDPANNYAARKAFIVTRIGDTALLIGLFLLIREFGTLDIATIANQANQVLGINLSMATIVSLLLLGGAVGKSAQLPLQVWLPDAMAGPSPVSALIHAATMVTAGVYLIARTHAIFALSPFAMQTVAIIGALTLLIAAISALFQYDIKRVLAYSTISQIGYMFLALGVGAWSAAIFHFVIHAFFKALLFLAAGAVIMALHHEQNMFKMGGLYKKMPVVFATFLIGSLSLAALPFISGGFFSKDSIIWYAYASENGNLLLWSIATIGAFITSLYTFRMIFITFFGNEKTHIHYTPGKTMTVPLIILAVLTTAGGYIELPHNLAHLQLFSGFLSSTLPQVTLKNVLPPEGVFQLIVALLSLMGIWLAYQFYLKTEPVYKTSPTRQFFLNGWNFDKLYEKLFVRPFVWLSNINSSDAIDEVFDFVGLQIKRIGNAIAITLNGQIRWYLTSMIIGLIILILFMMWT
ncbi:MAG: NADH-quinone oxidoreductase subunit L [Bacteroidales bacterium]|nr:NADH-quinone oxidoreductase subunit L [Bacteroidales bacterium]